MHDYGRWLLHPCHLCGPGSGCAPDESALVAHSLHAATRGAYWLAIRVTAGHWPFCLFQPDEIERGEAAYGVVTEGCQYGGLSGECTGPLLDVREGASPPSPPRGQAWPQQLFSCCQKVEVLSSCLGQWLADWIDVNSFCRSFFLLQLLALVRLWVKAVSVSNKAPRRRRVVRSFACSLQGAPFALVLCFATVGVHGVPAPQGRWRLASSSAPHARTVIDVDDEVLCGETEPSSGCVPAGTSAGSGLSAGEDWLPQVPTCFVAQVFQLQRAPWFTAVPQDCAGNSVCFCRAVESAYNASAKGIELVEVRPQPSGRCASFLAVPHRALQSDRVPVCLQLTKGCDDVRVWMDLLPEMLSPTAVADALG